MGTAHLFKLLVVMNSNVFWGALRPKKHYPKHYFAALPNSYQNIEEQTREDSSPKLKLLGKTITPSDRHNSPIINMTSPEPSSDKNNFKSLLIKGVISATALAGTTAIPLLVQRSLQTPTPTVTTATPTPSPTTPSPTTSTPTTQVSPPTASPQMAAPATSQQKPDQDNSDKKPKKKS
jgi:cytoskeletal protein RodZ